MNNTSELVIAAENVSRLWREWHKNRDDFFNAPELMASIHDLDALFPGTKAADWEIRE